MTILSSQVTWSDIRFQPYRPGYVTNGRQMLAEARAWMRAQQAGNPAFAGVEWEEWLGRQKRAYALTVGPMARDRDEEMSP